MKKLFAIFRWLDPTYTRCGYQSVKLSTKFREYFTISQSGERAPGQVRHGGGGSVRGRGGRRGAVQAGRRPRPPARVRAGLAGAEVHAAEDHVQDAGDTLPGAQTGIHLTLAVEFLNLDGDTILIDLHNIWMMQAHHNN